MNSMEAIKQKIIDLEEECFRLRDQIWMESDYDEEVGEYLTDPWIWQPHRLHPQIDSKDSSAPELEHTLMSLQPKSPTSGKRKYVTDCSNSQSGSSIKRLCLQERETDIGDMNNIRPDPIHDQSKSDISLWLTKLPDLNDKVIALEPYKYISSMQKRKIRYLIIDALDFWYKVPLESLEIIKNVVELLQRSSVILDDMDDGPALRRARGTVISTHQIFGIPSSINSANYLFFKGLEMVQKLSPYSVAIYARELRNLHVGQSLELHWAFHGIAPSDEEYIRMIDAKNGGLFRMAGLLMKDQATTNKNLDVEELLNILGRFVQICDDYINIYSRNYFAYKAENVEDLDEGRLSFTILHALRHPGSDSEDEKLKGLLHSRSMQSNGRFTSHQMVQAIKIISNSRGKKYSEHVLTELQTAINSKLEILESTGIEKNLVMMSVMEKLRVADLNSLQAHNHYKL
ncbi:hypothetical protein TWF694_000469 [Orbilia ellipsospora]|uniref:Uncharacterized protein n=1 Tax=Orbilia ellipsospora TaxID=2528407 RepID=A0AAV9XPK0_9PEZI